METAGKGRRLLATIVLMGPLLCLQACSVGPDFQQPGLASVMEDDWLQIKQQKTTDNKFASDRQPDKQWWRQFQDEALNRLIERLFASNIPLARARERIVEVNARQGVVAADRRLQLAAALGYTHAETGDEVVSLQSIPPGKTLDIYSTGLTAGWELDLWGRTARLLEAGEQDIRTSYADLHGLQVSLAAELSLAYFEARTLAARIEKVKENLVLEQKTRGLAQSRYDAGNGSALEIARTDRLISTTRSRLPELERSLAVAGNRINVLLGLPPREPVLYPGPLPAVPQLIGVGLPADLLTRRPDIDKALAGYHAAIARIGAAQAEKYPTLAISGTLTLSTDTFGGLFDSDSLMYTLGPGLRFPLLTGGRLEANIGVRKSQAEQARLALEQQIVEALAEVENASTGVVRSLERASELNQAEKFAIKSVALADELYQAGLGDLYQVLDNQQQLINIQESLLLARQQALAEVVALYRALGGGWQGVGAAAVENGQN